MQAGEDARTLAGKVVGVTARGAVQGLAGHDGPRGGGGRGGAGGGGGGGAQDVLVDDDVLHLVVELVVADLVGTGFALRQEALLPASHGGRRGHHGPRRGHAGAHHLQGQVAAGLVDDDLPLASAVPRDPGRRGVARLGDGHRALPGELLRLDDLDGVHWDGDGLASEAGHSLVWRLGLWEMGRWGGAVDLISALTPVPGFGHGDKLGLFLCSS